MCTIADSGVGYPIVTTRVHTHAGAHNARASSLAGRCLVNPPFSFLSDIFSPCPSPTRLPPAHPSPLTPPPSPDFAFAPPTHPCCWRRRNGAQQYRARRRVLAASSPPSSPSPSSPNLRGLVASLVLSLGVVVGRASGWKDCVVSPEDKWEPARERTPALRMRYDYERRYTCPSTKGGWEGGRGGRGAPKRRKSFDHPKNNEGKEACSSPCRFPDETAERCTTIRRMGMKPETSS